MIYAARAIDEMNLASHEEKVGADILKNALSKPAYFIAANAGEEGALIVEKIKNSKDYHFGYNAATDTFEDLFKTGVIDPAKVVRSALQNAVSIAGLFLTTECIVTDIQEEAPAMPPMPPGGGGMPGMY